MYETKTMEMEILASLLLFLVGIAALVVIHLCIVGRVFRGDVNGDGKIPGRISNQELKNLPSFNYSSTREESSSANGDCVVCLDMFKEGDKCRKLPNCNHSFHVECIDYWLLKTAVCPICRTRVCSSNVFAQQNSDSGLVAIDLT